MFRVILILFLIFLPSSIPNLMIYLSPLRWVLNGSKKERIAFLLINTLMATIKFYATLCSMIFEIPEYPYISEFASNVFLCLCLILLHMSFSEFAEYSCLPSLIFSIFSIFSAIPLQKAMNNLVPTIHEAVAIIDAGGSIPQETIFEMCSVALNILIETGIASILTYIIMDYLKKRFTDPLANKLLFVDLFCFSLTMILKIVSFIQVLQANGNPFPPLDMTYKTIICLSMGVFLAAQMMSLTDAYIKKLQSARLLEFQTREFMNEQALLKSLHSYLKEIEIYLNDLVGKINSCKPLDQTFNSTMLHHFADNSIADIILAWCDQVCQQYGIKFTVSGILPKEIGLPYNEEASLYFNLLSNCLEAARKSSEEPFITLQFRVSTGKLLIQAVNSIAPEGSKLVRKADGGFLSSKRNAGQHGYGSVILKNITEQHGGAYTLELNEKLHQATTTIILSIREFPNTDR